MTNNQESIDRRYPSTSQMLRMALERDRAIAILTTGRSTIRYYAPLDPETLYEHDMLIANDDGVIDGPTTVGYEQGGEAEYVAAMKLITSDGKEI